MIFCTSFSIIADSCVQYIWKILHYMHIYYTSISRTTCYWAENMYRNIVICIYIHPVNSKFTTRQKAASYCTNKVSSSPHKPTNIASNVTHAFYNIL